MNKSPAAGANNQTDHEIAERILGKLKDQKRSQESLARDIGISHTTLRRSLDQSRGDRRSFSILELGRIAWVLDIHPSELMPKAFKDAA